jgi:hypothetical protein
MAALKGKSPAMSFATLRVALSRTIDMAVLIPFLSELMRAMNGLELKFRRGTVDEMPRSRGRQGWTGMGPRQRTCQCTNSAGRC